ncbi:L-ascorbate metabolism protein UlaG, beta-lactamase superfamily [Chitinophaga costaii]|uniref:L-ascorbate metabolism protein UlaG, beta-lactamase superfamily n=1 Tax=Chitinophaga costaii TaxID=1335309 RepID=A0A1C4EUX0_9BACT|nr:MBL fold metallo-hydrolase [Chitinophaga costaii]PUZ21632.1 MBL fold metallo-hydrolase [Chitinophaga costaii]SCC47384.1 L-ascorbate metabolism protein UlaG, beta-lactamase superfamily [Chitinophaga costaii]
MKFRTLAFCLAMIAGAAHAQLAPADSLKTGKGTLVIQPVEHASLVLSIHGTTIYADPAGRADLFKGLAAPNLVLITDIHGDHFDTTVLASIGASQATLVVPQAVADQLPAAYKAKAVVLKNGATTTLDGITIHAIPMYNLPESATAWHAKGRGNGYVLTIGGKHIYLSGDTQNIPEMRALKNIDVAFVCMNLPYTMDVPEAADAVLAFKPKVVYPYHYRGKNGLSDVTAFKTKVNAANKSIDVRLINWYPQP